MTPPAAPSALPPGGPSPDTAGPVDLLCLTRSRATGPARPARRPSGPAKPVPRRPLASGEPCHLLFH